MKISTNLLLPLATALAATVSVEAAVPARQAGDIDLTKFVYKARNNKSAFGSERMARIEAIDNLLDSRLTDKSRFSRSATPQSQADFLPSFTLEPSYYIGDVDGPNGEVWFYTMNLENEAINHPYFVEYKLIGYEIKLYNAKNELVGTVKDKMRYAEDESKVPYCDILPLVTSNFFNDDDKYEIIVGLAINTNTPGLNHYKSVVYQIDGQKDSEGNDLPICTLPDMVCDVLDATQPGGPETYYLAFMTEIYADEPTSDIQGKPEFWDYMMQSKIKLAVYGKGETNNPRCVMEYDIPLQCLPGDQETVPFLMSTTHGGKAYYAFSKYKESLYNPYYSIQEDISQRAENSLVIDLYEINGGNPVKVQTTEIPFKYTGSEADGLLASYYSIGNLRYTFDVDFEHYTDGGTASFYVTRQDKSVGNDEAYTSSYYLYNPAGQLVKTVFEGAEASKSMADIAGHEPQVMFVTTENGGYVFHFVDMVSCNEVSSFSHILKPEDSDVDEPMTSNLDRVADGDGYLFVDELRTPVDIDDNTYIRFAWIDTKGKVTRIDDINMGQDVVYAKSYIENAVLHHAALHSDDNMEYIVLIKRGMTDGTVQEQLLVGQVPSEDHPEGRDLLLLKPDHRGNLKTIAPFSAGDERMMLVSYYDDQNDRLSGDIYRLPLDSQDAAIEGVGSDLTKPVISFLGGTISAPGSVIDVFDTRGLKVASAKDSVNVRGLGTGVYIVKAGKEFKKIVVK